MDEAIKLCTKEIKKVVEYNQKYNNSINSLNNKIGNLIKKTPIKDDVYTWFCNWMPDSGLMLTMDLNCESIPYTMNIYSFLELCKDDIENITRDKIKEISF